MKYAYPIFITLLIIFLGLSSWLLYRTFSRPLTVAAREKTAPNAIIYQLQGQTYDEQGNLKNSYRAEKLTYYQYLDKSVLEQLQMTLYQLNQAPWYISANHGVYLEDKDAFRLQDHVKLYQPQGKNNPRSTLFTALLMLHLDKHWAETSEPVRYIRDYKQNRIVVNAVGAKAYQKSHHVYLLSKARGSYEPKD
jgi:lipopolysaccharide export system protein LptC